MARNPKIAANPAPVTGVYKITKRNQLGPDEHHLGWDRALAAALEKIGRQRGDYQVHVDFSAVVNVRNPGNIIEYHVTII
jgi:hypothetical protein